MISDAEITEYYKTVIVPKHFSNRETFIDVRERENRVKYLEKTIRDELINIGVDKNRISFVFDGSALNIFIIPESGLSPVFKQVGYRWWKTSDGAFHSLKLND